jgi:hypothetical protein
MAERSWRYYRAEAEQFRGHNVFWGPLDIDVGDRFVHYARQGKLGDGTDYFGIYCADHARWLRVQPQGLDLKEIAVKDVLVPNVYTTLSAEKVQLGTVPEDVGLEND